MPRPISLNMGERSLTLDLDELTIESTDEIRLKVAKILGDHELVVRYPFQVVKKDEGEDRLETSEEWYERVVLAEQSRKARQEGESDEDYQRRVYEIIIEDTPTRVAFEIIPAVCEVLGKPIPSVNDIKKARNSALGEFMFELLFYHNIAGADRFRVPSRTEGTGSGA